MKSKFVTTVVIAASALSMAVSPIAIQAAAAQDQGYGAPPPPDQPPPNQGYNQGYGQGDQGGPPPDDNGGPPPDGYYDNGQPPPPPPGYDGSAPPPPPPGYQPPPESAQQQAQDQRYAQYAQTWAQQNCVKSHGNVAAGAVIGGIFGALLGSAIGGPGHHGGGAAVGAVIGGTSGAAIAADSGGNETSPGCPPGYVVRGGAPDFYYAGYGGPYVYAAPGWYRPWIWYGGQWTYRPYPYHVWYYRHYYRGGGHWHH